MSILESRSIIILVSADYAGTSFHKNDRNKFFFRKIEFFRFLLLFFAEFIVGCGCLLLPGKPVALP